MVEVIPSQDLVSRHVDSPDKWRPEEQVFIEDRLFMFQRPTEVESVVWRKYASTLAEVHVLGCGRQRQKRSTKPQWTYEGAITATVKDVRAIKTSHGDGFEVVHDPQEGIHHAHIVFRLAESQEYQRQRRSNLKELLMKAFGPLDAHQCPQ